MESSDDLIAIVGNECRRKILQLLVLEPHYVSQLSKILDTTVGYLLSETNVRRQRYSYS